VANALIELLQNQEHAESMGRAARAWAFEEYSEEKFRERLADTLAIHKGTKSS
jgi:glycosyltransferase involved in cell wall biosynthesis